MYFELCLLPSLLCRVQHQSSGTGFDHATCIMPVPFRQYGLWSLTLGCDALPGSTTWLGSCLYTAFWGHLFLFAYPCSNVTFAIVVAAEVLALLLVAPTVDRLGRHNIVAVGQLLGGVGCLACAMTGGGIMKVVFAGIAKLGCSGELAWCCHCVQCLCQYVYYCQYVSGQQCHRCMSTRAGLL